MTCDLLPVSCRRGLPNTSRPDHPTEDKEQFYGHKSKAQTGRQAYKADAWCAFHCRAASVSVVNAHVSLDAIALKSASNLTRIVSTSAMVRDQGEPPTISSEE